MAAGFWVFAGSASASWASNASRRSRASFIRTEVFWRGGGIAGTLTTPPVAVRHAELRRRVAHEIHFDQDGGLVADDPAVVAGLDGDDLRRGELERRAVAVADPDASARDEPDVRVHAEVGADGVLHVRRPPESRLVDHALDAAAAGRRDVHLNAAHDAAVGAGHRREERIVRLSHINAGPSFTRGHRQLAVCLVG